MRPVSTFLNGITSTSSNTDYCAVSIGMQHALFDILGSKAEDFSVVVALLKSDNEQHSNYVQAVIERTKLISQVPDTTIETIRPKIEERVKMAALLFS